MKQRRRRSWTVLCGLGLALWCGVYGVCHAQTPDLRLLLVGNSYTYGHNLDQQIKLLLEAGIPQYKEVFTERVAPGGYRWEQHANDAKGNTDLGQRLVTDPNPLYKWDFVVLQEQSQIPGFPQTGQHWRNSLAGLKVLHGLIKAKGAKTVLLMTWGRRQGDATNKARFPDFKTMQARLTEGYRAYAAQAGSAQAPILIAPVGLAFEKVYDDLKAAGKDPLDTGSPFSKLYEGDDSHPSLRGAYLAACVLYATITGTDPQQSSYTPAGMTPAEAQLYQAAAWDVARPTPSMEPSTEPPTESSTEPKAEPKSEPSPETLLEPTKPDASSAEKDAPDVQISQDNTGPVDAPADGPATTPAKEPATPDVTGDKGGAGTPPGQGCCQAYEGVPPFGLVLLVIGVVVLLRKREAQVME